MTKVRVLKTYPRGGGLNCPPLLLFERGIWLIQRAANRHGASVQHVRVDHRRLHVFMTEEFLDGANIVPGFQ